MEENTNNTQAATSSNGQTVIINQQVRKTNGIGIAGFILALISLLICWIPILSWVLWVLGAIFSFVGLFKTPRGLAIAGTIISAVTLVILILCIAAVTALINL